MNFKSLKKKFLKSKLFKDSFWAVFGNGLGNGIMLLAGIIIARFLGKDLYGEYGFVKSTMFLIASFTTFGLGFSTTRYISNFTADKVEYIRSVVFDSTKITLTFSCSIALLLYIFSPLLANYLGDTNFVNPLKYLSLIIVFRSLTMTFIGILAGFKDFQIAATNNIISASVLLIISVPLSYYYGLKGALISLAISQVLNSILNGIKVYGKVVEMQNQVQKSFILELLKFSCPLALQEASFSLCNWSGILFLTKYSSAGELGLYTASVQWNAIILMIPNLLFNVVLSHLSGLVKDKAKHDFKIKQLFIINIVCTLIPFLFVFVFANTISSFYGPTFNDMPNVLRVLTFATILEAGASVFKSDFLAKGLNWQFFLLRFLRDALMVGAVYLILSRNVGINGALIYSWSMVGASLMFLIFSLVYYIEKN